MAKRKESEQFIGDLLSYWEQKTVGTEYNRKRNLYRRHSNLITFLTGWYAEEERLHNEAVIAVARGLGDMGSSVCVINPTHTRRAPHTNPVPSDHKMVHYLHTTSRSDVVDACGRFDYVLVVDKDAYSHNLGGASYSDISERFIVMSGSSAVTKSNPLVNRTFFMVTTPDFAALRIDDQGYPTVLKKIDTLELASNKRLPRHLNVPVIGCYYPSVNRVELAKAVLGIGDPGYFYTTHKRLVMKNATFAIPNWMISSANGLMTLVGLTTLSADGIIGPAILGAAAVGMGFHGVRLFSPRTLLNGFKNKRPTPEQIYPASSDTMHVKYALSAPPLGMAADEDGVRAVEGMSTAMYMGDLVWAKTRERYDAVMRRWNAYELDITKMLDAPLITDYSCPQTAAFVQAMHKARDLCLAVEDERSRQGRSVAVVRGLFAEAVSEMEIAFEVAENNAIKAGIRGFAEADRKKIARSKQLFKIAQNSGSSDHERMEALKQARKQLEGILVVSERAITALEASAGLAQITA